MALGMLKTLWPSGLRRWLKAPFRKGVGSNPTAVTALYQQRPELKQEANGRLGPRWLQTVLYNTADAKMLGAKAKHNCLSTGPSPFRTVWPSGLRRWLKAPFRKGMGSNPTAVKCRAAQRTATLRRSLR